MSERIRAVVPVFVFLLNEQNEVYLQKRANTGYMDGFYDTPSGKTDEGESPKVAAKRELMEEAGVQVDEKDLELFHSYLNITEEPWLGLMFRTKRWQGDPKICEPEKCDEAGFYSLEAIPNHVTQQVSDGLARVVTANFIEVSYYDNI